jgi:cell division inhibitor SulA/protein ImuA
MALDLDQLPQVWRAESLSHSRLPHIASGHGNLDMLLGGGWPVPALIELLCDEECVGELTLLLPLLRALLDQRKDGVALWIAPPHALHGVALLQRGLDPARHWLCPRASERDAAWAMELALKSNACAVVLAWLRQPAAAVLRRLKLATSSGQTTAILFRSTRAAQTPSPATLRLQLRACTEQLEVQLLKMQGRRPGCVTLDVSARLEVPA